MSSNPNETLSPRIAIVGGGISGLTAAYRLSKLLPQAKLELFEASDRLGGMLYTSASENTLLECGADSFITTLPAAENLCRELGLGDELIPTNEASRRALILHQGRLHPVPEGFVLMRPEKFGPMVRTGLLSTRGKLRLLAERFVPRAPGIEKADYDESVASFATRRLGSEVFERLVQPLLAGIYTADPYKLSVAATMPVAIEGEREYGSLCRAVLAARQNSQGASRDSGARYASFVTLRSGLGKLIDTLELALNKGAVHLNTPIVALARTLNDRWAVSRSADAAAEEFDGVVLALPAPHASRLVRSLDEPLSDSLGSIPYASSAVAALVYRRDQIRDPLDGFGLVIPTIENRQIVSASYSSIKFPGRAPDDQVLIRVFIGGALQPELLDREDHELVKLASSELAAILGITGTPLSSELIRWQQKMPQYHVGHLQLVDRIERQLAEYPRLQLAGNAYRGVGIPQCVARGESAARQLAAELSSVSPSNC